MEWFWGAYTTDPAARAEITASPNRASAEQVSGLPPAYLCVDEADVLRDEGEAYQRAQRDPRHPGRDRPGRGVPARWPGNRLSTARHQRSHLIPHLCVMCADGARP
jgi:acetyl esterase/lipase